MSDGGKGSRQRPTDKKKFDEGWERIFGKKKEKSLYNLKKISKINYCPYS